MGRAFLTLLMVLTLATVADAQPSDADRAAATTLFDDARELMRAGDYASACPKLREAKRLAPGAGIVFNFAVCLEKTKRTAGAWTLYREAASLSQAAGQEDRAADARQRADALETRLTRMEIVVVDPPRGLTITRNGDPVGSALWNTATPIDPGRFEVVADAPGFQPWRTAVDATKPAETVRVSVPTLIPQSQSAPPPSSPPLPVETDAASNDWQMPLGVSMLAIGVVGVGVGGVLGLVAKSNADDADCDDNNICRTPEAVETRSDAVSLGNVATVVMIAGAVVGGAGLVVWLTAPGDDDEVALDVGPASLGLRYRF